MYSENLISVQSVSLSILLLQTAINNNQFGNSLVKIQKHVLCKFSKNLTSIYCYTLRKVCNTDFVNFSDDQNNLFCKNILNIILIRHRWFKYSVHLKIWEKFGYSVSFGEGNKIFAKCKFSKEIL